MYLTHRHWLAQTREHLENILPRPKLAVSREAHHPLNLATDGGEIPAITIITFKLLGDGILLVFIFKVNPLCEGRCCCVETGDIPIHNLSERIMQLKGQEVGVQGVEIDRKCVSVDESR